MRKSCFFFAVLFALHHVPFLWAEEAPAVRDRIWVWGNQEMATPGPHTPETFAQAGPAERAQILGASNIILAGNGLPADERAAAVQTRGASQATRLVWEVSADFPESATPFTYDKTTEPAG